MSHNHIHYEGQDIQICTKCVLPSTFPGISFNEEGVCNHCIKFETFAATPAQRIEFQNKLRGLLEQFSTDLHKHQVLMAYSGGKDSTYSMQLLVEKYHAEVVAFTFENGFISPQAHKNIRTVCDYLGVKHIMVEHDQQVMQTLIRHAAGNDMYPRQTMERASTICTMCSGFFKSAAYAVALESNIPMIGYGWSPGQAPIQSSLQKANPKFVKMAQKNVTNPVVKVIGEEGRKYFLQDHHYDFPAEKWPVSIHPLAFEDYNEEAIKDSIRSIGWVDPTDVDTNSTNCMLNAFANQVHLDRYKFSPYVQEIANMVRNKTMTREEAIEKIYTSQNQELVQYAKDVLGL